MWRFTRDNGITEGFHNKLEVINRQTYGFRKFDHYEMRVKLLCGNWSGIWGLSPRCWRRAKRRWLPG
jgi:transposase